MINANNVWSGYGRLTADPELKTTTSGKEVCSFTLAVDEGKNSTHFFRVVAWDKTAKFVVDYFRKGKQIAVVGTLTQRKYEDKQGNKREIIEIRAESVGFIGSKEDKPEAVELSNDLPF